MPTDLSTRSRERDALIFQILFEYRSCDEFRHVSKI